MFNKKASLGKIQNPSDDFEIASKLKSIGQKLLVGWDGGRCEINVVPLPNFDSNSQNLTGIQESGNSENVVGFGDRYAEIKILTQNDSEANQKPITIPIHIVDGEIKIPSTFAFAGEELIFSPDNVKKAIGVFKKMAETDGIDSNSAFEGVEDFTSDATDIGDFDRTIRLRDEAFATHLKIAMDGGECPKSLYKLMKEASYLKPLASIDIDIMVADAIKSAEAELFAEKLASDKSNTSTIKEIGDFALQTHQAIELFKTQGIRDISRFSNNSSITVIARDGQGDVDFKPGRVFLDPKVLVTENDKTFFKTSPSRIVVTSDGDYKVLAPSQKYKTLPSVDETTLSFINAKDLLDGKQRLVLFVSANEVYGPYNVQNRIFNQDKVLSNNTLMNKHEGATPQHGNVLSLDTNVHTEGNTFEVLVKDGAKFFEKIPLKEAVDVVLSTLKEKGVADKDFPSRYDIFGWYTTRTQEGVPCISPDAVAIELKQYMPGHLRDFEDIFLPESEKTINDALEKNASEIILKSASSGQVKIEKPAPDIETYNLGVRIGASSVYKKGLTKQEAIKFMLDAGVPSTEVGVLIGIVNSGARDVAREYKTLVIPEDKGVNKENIVKKLMSGLVQGDVANNALTSVIAQQLGDIVVSGGPAAMSTVGHLSDAFGKMASADLRISAEFEKMARENQSLTCLKVASALRASHDINHAFRRAVRGGMYDFSNIEKAAKEALPELHYVGSELLKLAKAVEVDQSVDFDHAIVMHAAESVDRLVKIANKEFYVK